MRRRAWIVTAFTLMMAWAVPAFGLQAGITLDVHQDIYDPAFWPNDFHIRGYICSNDGIQPNLIDHVDDVFGVPPGTFTWTIQKVSTDPTDCWYWFEATWAFPAGQGYIPYCTVLHFGLLFDVDAANVIIDLVGWWTRDGVPVGGMIGGLNNSGYVPAVGFNVQDTSSPQIVTIGNGLLPPLPPLPPDPLPPPPINPPPWPPDATELWILQADVIPFPPGSPPDFRELWEFGQQQTWPGWVPVTHNNGVPISPGQPLYWAPDSFFDIFLEMSPPPDPENLGVLSTFSIEPGGFLVARQRVQFLNNNQQVEERWFWEIHGAQENEACCFPNGTCRDILPFDCLQQGGIPQGPGTVCYPGLCPAQGACCYGTVALLCIVTDQQTCEQQYLGQWKGVGTNCDDLDGDGVADICEEVQETQACCLPNGTCVMLPVEDCLQMLGTPMGAGTRCLNDLNENGTDDLCEAKWYQMPDLSTNGIDIYACKPLILADDFLCTKRTLITDIRVWGSWLNDILPAEGAGAVEFTLSIHADIPDPDGEGPLYSMPGQVLWFRKFAPFTFNVQMFQSQIDEGWWDPRTPSYIFPGDHVCWLYYFQVPEAEAFCQEGSPENPIVYWLDVQARPVGEAAVAQFGWKTSIDHWNDDAVWGQGIEPYPGPWQELRYPPGHELHPDSIDLAFAIAGDHPCVDELDFGDAPDSYQTLLASNGARHAIVPGVMLGASIDAEPDGQPDPLALGDDNDILYPPPNDDEDGIVFLTPLARGRPATFDVIASTLGAVSAWIDFDGNGSFAEADNMILAGASVGAGVTTFTIVVPPTAVLGPTFARFRFCTPSVALPFFGTAPDGEVEDYAVEIVCPCLADVNGDNTIDGLDIQCFVDCFVGGVIPAGCYCPCADMDGNGIVDMGDVPLFVNALLYNTGPCP